MARQVVLIRKCRLNGPRKSRGRVGLRPTISFIVLTLLTAFLGIALVVEPELAGHSSSVKNAHIAQTARQSAGKRTSAH